MMTVREKIAEYLANECPRGENASCLDHANGKYVHFARSLNPYGPCSYEDLFPLGRRQVICVDKEDVRDLEKRCHVLGISPVRTKTQQLFDSLHTGQQIAQTTAPITK
jgi:hypothetical protein